MAALVVQSSHGAIPSTVVPFSTPALPAPTTAGNTLILVVSDATFQPTAVVGGGAWTKCVFETGPVVQIWECPNVTQNTRYATVTAGTGATGAGWCALFEVSGLLNTGAFDQSVAASVTSAGASVTNVPMSAAHEFVVAGFMSNSGTSTAQATGGWTDVIGGTGVTADAAYIIPSSSVVSPQSTHWPLSGSSAWSAVGASFKLAGSPPLTPLQVPTMAFQIAPNNNPLDAAPTWSDVTTYVQNFHTSLGRMHELDRIESAQMSAVFDERSSSASFTPWNAGSPYATQPLVIAGASVVAGNLYFRLPASALAVIQTEGIITGPGLPANGVVPASVFATGGQTQVSTNQAMVSTITGASVVANQGLGLIPRKPVRIQATYASVTYNLYYGFTDSWVPKVQDELTQTVELKCYDALKLLSLSYLVNTTLYPSTINNDGATAFYRCGETSGGFLYDSSASKQLPALLAGPAGYAAQAVALYDPTTGLDLSGGSGGTAAYILNDVAGSVVQTYECWFNTTYNAITQVIMGAEDTVLAGSLYEFMVLLQPGGNLELILSQQTTTTPGAVVQHFFTETHGGYNDGNWHHLAVTWTGPSSGFYALTMYVDGVGSATSASSYDPPNGLFFTGGFYYYGSAGAVQGAVAQFVGQVCNIAMYPTVLTPTQLLNHFTVGMYLRRAETTGNRIAEVLIVAGWGAFPQSLATGTQTCQETNSPVTGTTALSYIYNVVDTENGVFFQSPTPSLVFLDRHYTYTNPTSITSQATLGDNASAFYHYMAAVFASQTDDLDVWTDAQVTRVGGVLQEISSIAARTAVGFSTLQRSSVLFADDASANYLAQFLVYLYSIPTTRVQAVMLGSEVDGGRALPIMLGATLLERFTIQRQPPGSTQFVQDSVVESISHDYVVEPGPTLHTTLNMSPHEIAKNFFVFGQAGSDTLDGPAVLGG